ncbi:MAG TPA: hypothetical protein VFW94_16565 [Candidatus Acidoferrales bacterium]|nr:hypothetical protein [Candidatus Acidoferrales bacterium]
MRTDLKSSSARPFFPVAPPVHGLNVVRVIVAPGAVHAAGTDVLGNDVALIGELLFANAADAVLGNDLPVEQLAHFRIRAEFPVASGMMWIVDAADTHLAWAAFFWDYLLPQQDRERCMGQNWFRRSRTESSWLAKKPLTDWGNQDCPDRKCGT